MYKGLRKMFLFVYGTLQSGQPNHRIMQECVSSSGGTASLVGRAETLERRPLIVATRYNIPFLLDNVGQGKIITGELYEVDDKVLAACDELEGYPQYYQRLNIKVKVLHKDNQTSGAGGALSEAPVTAYVYALQNFKPELLHMECLSAYDNNLLAKRGQSYVCHKDRAEITEYDPKRDVLLETYYTKTFS